MDSGLDFSSDEFDYDKFVAEEFGGTPRKKPMQWFWWATAVLVLIASVMLILRGVM